LTFLSHLRSLLDQEAYETLRHQAEEHAARVANGLIGLLTDSNEKVKWRAVIALGQVSAQLFRKDPEGVRKIIRQLIWNLNDESGGIGWGMPEALGEILAQVPALQKEYLDLFIAYISEEGCFLENPLLQAGVVWGIGRIKKIDEVRTRKIVPFLLEALNSQNLLLKGTAVWTLGELKIDESISLLKALQKENRMVKISCNGEYQEKPLRQWVDEALQNIMMGGKNMAENEWKCSNCGYTLKKDVPPDQCPSCNQKCEFLNVTCYIPECESTGSDQRIK
jgi:HEAT repeat protein/rubredoxin